MSKNNAQEEAPDPIQAAQFAKDLNQFWQSLQREKKLTKFKPEQVFQVLFEMFLEMSSKEDCGKFEKRIVIHADYAQKPLDMYVQREYGIIGREWKRQFLVCLAPITQPRTLVKGMLLIIPLGVCDSAFGFRQKVSDSVPWANVPVLESPEKIFTIPNFSGHEKITACLRRIYDSSIYKDEKCLLLGQVEMLRTSIIDSLPKDKSYF